MKNGRPVFLAFLAAAFLFVGRPSFSATSGVDLAAAAAAVREADAHWAAAAGTAGVDAWMAFYAADAIVLLPDGRLASGKGSVRRTVARFLALPRLSVAWRPIKVQMARSGDLAYVIGAFELHFGASPGTRESHRGRLLEIWRKQTDGAWKCFVDTWNLDEPAAPPPPRAAVAQSAAPATNLAAPPSPPPAHAPDAKYGDMPVHYEEAIRQYFQEHLKDPGSVRYRQIAKPTKGYTTAVTGTFLMRETRKYGWIVNVIVNAENSRGRYVGFKSYTFLFRGEKIVATRSPLPEDEMN